MTDKPCREERAALDEAERESDMADGASLLPEPERTGSGDWIIRLTDEQWEAVFEARERRPEAKRKKREALDAFDDCMSAHRMIPEHISEDWRKGKIAPAETFTPPGVSLATC